MPALLVILATAATEAQSISGRILDEYKKPVPFANILVQETGQGTSADDQGNYYLTIDPGVYHFVVSSLGYTSLRTQVITGDGRTTKDFQLASSAVELHEITVKARRRDPAYEIMQKAIDKKDDYLTQVKSSRTKLYMRAWEDVDIHEKKKLNQEVNELNSQEGLPDPFAKQRDPEAEKLARMNLVEMELVLNYKYPDQFKEERMAFKLYGSKAGLFIPVFHQADFNFYKNLVNLKGISEIPMISPLSKLAVLSYRFKLEGILKDGDNTVYQIKVTPRKSGDATANGYVFINDSTWNINRLELTLHKGALKFYDDFTIKQTYQEVNHSLWIPSIQEFSYTTKAGRKLFKGNTVLVYSEFEKDYEFPPRFFGNEVSVTKSEAYKRDSAYWSKARLQPLDTELRKLIIYRDSVEAVRTSRKYLDSIEAAYNRVTFGDLIYDGVGFRNDEKRKWIHFPPLLGLIDFAVVGGWRIKPSMFYFKRFENERTIWTGGGVSVGIKNEDVQGYGHFHTRYDPFRQSEAAIRFGREFYSINPFDAYLNQLKISNYIVRDYLDLYHRTELFNGFYISTELKFSDRQSVEGYDATSIINEVIDEVEPIEFEGYQAFVSHLRVAYTPAQKYMREPHQKVVLGSKYPTLVFNHQKGWKGPLSSDVDFDYVDAGLEQSLLLGTLGNSRYTVTMGKFINAKDLRYIDLKRFRQSDPYLYSDPMHSFQLLDTALATPNWFIEAHYLHYFNGAMINNIPLVKKLRLRTVAGAGFMWIEDSNYSHAEIFGGVERVFKLGARRRLKIGVYAAFSKSEFFSPKVSFDIIDTWKREWTY